MTSDDDSTTRKTKFVIMAMPPPRGFSLTEIYFFKQVTSRGDQGDKKKSMEETTFFKVAQNCQKRVKVYILSIFKFFTFSLFFSPPPP